MSERGIDLDRRDRGLRRRRQQRGEFLGRGRDALRAHHSHRVPRGVRSRPRTWSRRVGVRRDGEGGDPPTRPRPPPRVRTCSTPTSGRAWGRKPSARSGSRLPRVPDQREVLARAKPACVVLHCLPGPSGGGDHRGSDRGTASRWSFRSGGKPPSPRRRPCSGNSWAPARPRTPRRSAARGSEVRRSRKASAEAGRGAKPAEPRKALRAPRGRTAPAPTLRGGERSRRGSRVFSSSRRSPGARVRPASRRPDRHDAPALLAVSPADSTVDVERTGASTSSSPNRWTTRGTRRRFEFTPPTGRPSFNWKGGSFRVSGPTARREHDVPAPRERASSGRARGSHGRPITVRFSTGAELSTAGRISG